MASQAGSRPRTRQHQAARKKSAPRYGRDYALLAKSQGDAVARGGNGEGLVDANLDIDEDQVPVEVENVLATGKRMLTGAGVELAN